MKKSRAVMAPEPMPMPMPMPVRTDAPSDPSMMASMPGMAGMLGSAQEPIEIPPEEDSIPEQGGLFSSKNAIDSSISFEDHFPKLDLSDDERDAIASWFSKDLKVALRCVNENRGIWGKYRAVYLMEYIEKFYPDMGIGASFSSGLLCERVLEGMNRMKKAVFGPRPLFAPDPEESGSDQNIDTMRRAQWFLHTLLTRDLKVRSSVGDSVLFDFLIDGSAIVEADTVYEKVPQRTIKTYMTAEELMDDSGKLVDKSKLDQAFEDIGIKGMARVLVESDVVTRNGLQLFHVDKMDHLIPPNVYEDDDLRFRARRMYLTAADLRTLASDDVGWYDKKEVEKVIGMREEGRGYLAIKDKNPVAYESLQSMLDQYDLCYPWQDDESLTPTSGSSPYQEMFHIYRVTAKYGYATGSDPKGDIPKYCIFDFSPEGGAILRAVTYPHFYEKRNWFHFKLGYAPKSYYGFGFGKRLLSDDFLESNAIGLYMDSAALATWNPFIVKHPDAGGIFPFPGGYGPAKIGYAMNPKEDFEQLRVPPPNDAIVRNIVPITQTRASNRTNVTSLVQGRTETADPRSPAQKTAMLLGQASVGIGIMVDDWNLSGWNKLAEFTWSGAYETAVYLFAEDPNMKVAFDGLVLREGTVPQDAKNIVTLDELHRSYVWKALASADYLNPEIRSEKFIKLFGFFVPLLREMAQFNPEAYKKYFLRWMERAAYELDTPGMDYLIPTQEDLTGIPAEGLATAMEGVMKGIGSGQAPWMANLSSPGNEPPIEQVADQLGRE